MLSNAYVTVQNYTYFITTERFLYCKRFYSFTDNILEVTDKCLLLCKNVHDDESCNHSIKSKYA